MPTYSYKCHGCGHGFEKMVSIAKKDEVDCPECGSKEIKRNFTSFNIGKGAPSGGGAMPDCGMGQGGCPGATGGG